MTTLGQRFQDALAFAAEAHKSQHRKGTSVPYTSHLLQVAGIALEHGADEDVAIAALLHDAAEDQGGEAMLDQIEERYGRRVATIVHACSDTFESPKPGWRRRKEIYIAHLADATPDACLVSAADKLHNARTIVEDLRAEGTAAFGKFKGGHEGTLWYYATVLDALEGKVPLALHAALGRTVRAMHDLATGSC